MILIWHIKACLLQAVACSGFLVYVRCLKHSIYMWLDVTGAGAAYELLNNQKNGGAKVGPSLRRACHLFTFPSLVCTGMALLVNCSNCSAVRHNITLVELLLVPNCFILIHLGWVIVSWFQVSILDRWFSVTFDSHVDSHEVIDPITPYK